MIDLHIHSTWSDGTSSPAELLEEASHMGLEALAITDHDTLAGFDVARCLANEYGMELICGIELSTQYEHPSEPKLPVHLLGYFPEFLPGDDFRAWLFSISSTRRERNLKLMDMLQSLNICISWEDFPDPDPDHIARPHFASILVAKGYAPDRQTAFDRFLHDSILTGITPRVPSTQEAIQKIVENGGVASIAHPGRLCCSGSLALASVIEELAECGLHGIETYHSDHSPESIRNLLQIASVLNLLVTGGSDYHGSNKPDIHLGTGRNGNLHLPYAILERIKESPRKGKIAVFTPTANTR